jgi:nucleoside-diphosphate-sugar epimerase
MIRAAENPNTLGKIYILGESKPYSIVSIRDRIADVLKKRPLRIITPPWALLGVATLFELHGKITGRIPALTRNEVMSYTRNRYWCYDSRRAGKDFGFCTRYTLEEGVKITAEWYTREGLI